MSAIAKGLSGLAEWAKGKRAPPGGTAAAAAAAGAGAAGPNSGGAAATPATGATQPNAVAVFTAGGGGGGASTADGRAPGGEGASTTTDGEGNLRFRVLKVTKTGVHKPRLLVLNIADGNLSLIKSGEVTPSKLPLSLGALSHIEKSTSEKDKQRGFLVFYGDFRPPWDLVFADMQTRDIFCELAQSINKSIVIKDCALERTPLWVPDSQTNQCMRGDLVCGSCSSKEAVLPDMGYAKPVRVCDKCFDSIRDWRLMALSNNKGPNAGQSFVRTGTAAGATSGSHAKKMSVKVSSVEDFKPKPTTNNATSPANAAAAAAANDDDAESPSGGSGPVSASPAISPAAAASPSDDPNAVVTLPPSLLLGDSAGANAADAASSPSDAGASSGGGDGAGGDGDAGGKNEKEDVERDVYGFPVNKPAPGDPSFEITDLTQGENYEVELEKQRKAWNSYLVLNAKVEKTKELKKLVRNGIPPELRGHIWQVLTGSKEKQSKYKPGYYATLLKRAEKTPTHAIGEIEKDLRRTFPDNALFESKDGLDMLRRVLVAYSIHNARVGYCQSMNFVCALLLLFMDEEDAFWMLSCMVEDLTCIDLGPAYVAKLKQQQAAAWAALTGADPSQMPPELANITPAAGTGTAGASDAATASGGDGDAPIGVTIPASTMLYHQTDLGGAHVDQAVFRDLVAEKIPKIHQKLVALKLPLEPLTINWFLSLFVNTLPLETCLHVWDCLFSEGIKVLFRAALTLLKVNEKLILKATDFEQLLGFLKQFSQSAVDSNQFVKMCFDKSWIGSFSSKRINQHRIAHKNRIEEDLAKNAAMRKKKIVKKPAAAFATAQPGAAAGATTGDAKHSATKSMSFVTAADGSFTSVPATGTVPTAPVAPDALPAEEDGGAQRMASPSSGDAGANDRKAASPTPDEPASPLPPVDPSSVGASNAPLLLSGDPHAFNSTPPPASASGGGVTAMVVETGALSPRSAGYASMQKVGHSPSIAAPSGIQYVPPPSVSALSKFRPSAKLPPKPHGFLSHAAANAAAAAAAAASAPASPPNPPAVTTTAVPPLPESAEAAPAPESTPAATASAVTDSPPAPAMAATIAPPPTDPAASSLAVEPTPAPLPVESEPAPIVPDAPPAPTALPPPPLPDLPKVKTKPLPPPPNPSAAAATAAAPTTPAPAVTAVTPAPAVTTTPTPASPIAATPVAATPTTPTPAATAAPTAGAATATATPTAVTPKVVKAASPPAAAAAATAASPKATPAATTAAPAAAAKRPVSTTTSKPVIVNTGSVPTPNVLSHNPSIAPPPVQLAVRAPPPAAASAANAAAANKLPPKKLAAAGASKPAAAAAAPAAGAKSGVTPLQTGTISGSARELDPKYAKRYTLFSMMQSAVIDEYWTNANLSAPANGAAPAANGKPAATAASGARPAVAAVPAKTAIPLTAKPVSVTAPKVGAVPAKGAVVTAQPTKVANGGSAPSGASAAVKVRTQEVEDGFVNIETSAAAAARKVAKQAATPATNAKPAVTPASPSAQAATKPKPASTPTSVGVKSNVQPLKSITTAAAIQADTVPVKKPSRDVPDPPPAGLASRPSRDVPTPDTVAEAGGMPVAPNAPPNAPTSLPPPELPPQPTTPAKAGAGTTAASPYRPPTTGIGAASPAAAGRGMVVSSVFMPKPIPASPSPAPASNAAVSVAVGATATSPLPVLPVPVPVKHVPSAQTTALVHKLLSHAAPAPTVPVTAPAAAAARKPATPAAQPATATTPKATPAAATAPTAASTSAAATAAVAAKPKAVVTPPASATPSATAAAANVAKPVMTPAPAGGKRVAAVTSRYEANTPAPLSPVRSAATKIERLAAKFGK